MANCKAETGIKHFIIDVRNEEEVIESLMEVMESDCDLTENEEYFRRNTLKLGYNSEADRIVKEYIKKKGVPNTIKAFKKAYEKMSDRISEQEFFGECEVSFVDIDENRVSVVFVSGGQGGI